MTTAIVTSKLLCLVACTLIARHAEGGHSAALASYVEAYDLPPMSFMMEPQLQRQHQRQQQQSIQADQLQSNDELLRLDNVKRASLKDMESLDSGNALRPASNQDLWRMIRLDQVLEALASSIPPATLGQNNWRKNHTQPLVVDQAAGLAPHSGPAPTFGSLVGARLAAAKAELAEQWPGVGGLNMLAGDARFGGLVGSPKSRKSTNGSPGGLVGLVWAPSSKPTAAVAAAASPSVAGGPVGSPTPFFSPQQPQLATRKLIGAGRSQTTQQPSSAASSSSSSLSSASHRSHRLGTEEVALHTPVHSASGTDYEWKRVENSRNWNNLRGMWGKRAINERYNDLETFRNMLETEARESALSKLSSSSSSSSLSPSPSPSLFDDNGSADDAGWSSVRLERDVQDNDDIDVNQDDHRQSHLHRSQSVPVM